MRIDLSSRGTAQSKRLMLETWFFAGNAIWGFYSDLSRRFFNFGLEAEIWGTPKSPLGAQKLSKNFFLKIIIFWCDLSNKCFVRQVQSFFTWKKNILEPIRRLWSVRVEFGFFAVVHLRVNCLTKSRAATVAWIKFSKVKAANVIFPVVQSSRPGWYRRKKKPG